MGLARQSLVEGVRALVVIALLFLSFGHGPVPAPVSYDAHLSAKVLNLAAIEAACGDPADHGDHAPCHACRVFSGLDLPPAPCSAAAAFGTVLSVAYAPTPAPTALSIAAPTVHPRGPPRA